MTDMTKDEASKLVTKYEPRYFVIWTSRFPERDGSRHKRVTATFSHAGPVARYLEALRPQDRPDHCVIDTAGHEVETIAHRDDYYSHASALLAGTEMWHPKDEMERHGWKFTDARGGSN